MPHVIKGALLAATLLAGAAQATTIEITVTNEQASGGLFLTPLLSIFHDGSYDTFTAGERASTGVQLLAEEGSPAANTTAFPEFDVGVIEEVEAANTANGTNFQTAVAANPNGFGGAPVLDPGEVTTITVDLDTSTQRFFSFLTMVIPSNDTFLGNDNPLAYELFDTDGNFIFNRVIDVLVGDAYDAGTEADDGNGAAFAPGTGTDATDTPNDLIALLPDLDFLVGRPQAPGGTVQSAAGSLLSISFREVAPVPLPAGLPLLALGLGALGLMRRRSKKS